jgi:SAM-dependent methyltransferase
MAAHFLAERYRQMLAARGYELTTKSKVLDFGCGSGSLVHALRDTGLDVVGFEPFGGVAPANDPLFTSLEWPNPFQPENYLGKASKLPDLTIDWRGKFRLPYPDATFDFVYSTEVMEHVSDHEPVVAELRRVMKPDGVAIHSFPSRYRLIEPHIHVPLGGIVKIYPWYRAWLTVLPKKNPWLVSLSRRELAGMSYWYARGSLHYRTPRYLARLGRKYYHCSSFVPELWEAGSADRLPQFGWLYTRIKNVIWMLERPQL